MTACNGFDSSRGRPIFQALFIMALACATALTLGQEPDRREPSPRFRFVQNLERWVQVIQGESILLGKLDANGRFVPQSRFRRGAGLSRVPPSELINPSVGGIKVYEFRSNCLVKGEIKDDGRFVPDQGSEVIDFKAYEYTPHGVRIYNLPGYFVEVKPDDRKRKE